MWPSLRVSRELRRLLHCSRPSGPLPATRHASIASKLKPREIPVQWSREEVSERLHVMEEAVGRGEALDPAYLAMLMAPIQRHRDPAVLSRVLQVVERSEVKLTESLGSALVSGLAEVGRVADIRRVMRKMQGRLRVQGQSSVLSLACREGDSELALEYLAGWGGGQPLSGSLVASLMALSRERQRSEVMEALLGVLARTRQSVDEEGVAEIRQWAESQTQAPFTSHTAAISLSGVCSSCQGQLDRAMTDRDNHQLLAAVTDAVHSEGLGFSPELISNLTRLKQRLVSMTTPYRVVVDGLNVSHVGAASFSIMQVMDVVNQLTATIGGPVLVVARKHLAQEMDQLPSFYSPVPRSKDFHVFTTHINEISDDICVIYAALTTGPDCYFVSNDHMSDNASMLSPGHGRLFTTWQASRQITVEPSAVKLMFPTDHGRQAQRSQGDGGWHIPISSRQQASEGKPAWILESRHPWNTHSLSQQRNWLCLRTN